MPTTTDTVTLACPFADGHGRQSTTVDLADFDDEHNPVASPTITVTNNQTGILEVAANPANPLEYKIRTKAPKPANISQATVSFSDGRTKSDGTGAVPPVVITVLLTNPPSAASFEISSTLPLTVTTEPDGAPMWP